MLRRTTSSPALKERRFPGQPGLAKKGNQEKRKYLAPELPTKAGEVWSVSCDTGPMVAEMSDMELGEEDRISDGASAIIRTTHSHHYPLQATGPYSLG